MKKTEKTSCVFFDFDFEFEILAPGEDPNENPEEDPPGDSNNDGVKDTPTTDECDEIPSDPIDLCKRLAQVEGSGSYTQDTNGSTGASGRYQINQTTAVHLMSTSNMVSSKSAGVALWQECRNSSSAKCVALQDSLCNIYATQLSKGLTGDTNQFRYLYLKWNMGPTGAKEILDAYPGRVTNPARISNMNNQAWMVGNPGNGDTVDYLKRMDAYIEKRGITSTASL